MARPRSPHPALNIGGSGAYVWAMTALNETPLHTKVSPNASGRDFVVGDLHGMRGALDEALARRRFDPARDRLFSVGDLVDRGPDSPGGLALLDEPWFYAVRGNHEEMMRTVLLGEDDPGLWLENGGDWYPALDDAERESLPAEAMSLPLAMTVETPAGRRVGLTHAEYPRDDWREVADAVDDPQDSRDMLWGRRVIYRRLRRDVRGVDLTVHGHTPLDSPTRLGNALFIDTGAVYGGPLTLMTLDEALDWPEAQP